MISPRFTSYHLVTNTMGSHVRPPLYLGLNQNSVNFFSLVLNYSTTVWKSSYLETQFYRNSQSLDMFTPKTHQRAYRGHIENLASILI